MAYCHQTLKKTFKISHSYIIKHITRQRKKPQGSDVYTEVAIMSERPVKFACTECNYCIYDTSVKIYKP